MPTIHRGATLTPHFREFLPGWVARQPWYAGSGVPELTPVGYFRFEDPAGAVGVETHLLRDDSVVYQVPLTYRDAPLDGPPEALVSTARHSVLGTRWIYDAVVDPVWVAEVSRLVATNGTSLPSGRSGVGPAEARGIRIRSAELMADATTIELLRRVPEGHPPYDPDAVGLVMGSWHPDGADGPVATGCLAVLHRDGV
ncbi:MAG TPA: hypothetical protein VFW65_22440 [Pseudonocardiaceae bacterium]|nr:hypothetical protein [Pseudonocardiaceae bacterium]